MRWPWMRQKSGDQLVVSWSGQALAYVVGHLQSDGSCEVRKAGVEHRGNDTTEDFIRRLQSLGFKGRDVCVMLRPEQYQLLQIDKPAVPPEELKSAARYLIRDMLLTHVDDVTLDVMVVGDGQQKGVGHLFVVAATHSVVREVLDLGAALQWTVRVIDVQETAQRNIQSALAARAGQSERANAALVLIEGQQTVLTISANEELFYTRRFDMPEGFLAGSWGQASDAVSAVPDSFMPVEEYVPDYSVGGVSYGTDYSDSRFPASAAAPAARGAGDDERAQRFLVEVQRSLDLWDRSWSSMPLNGMRVYAGERSAELSGWLASQLGQTVVPMDVKAIFSGFEAETPAELVLCVPLLGILLRTEN